MIVLFWACYSLYLIALESEISLGAIWIGRVDPYQNMLRKVLFCNDSTEKTANVELRKTMQ